MTQQVLRMGYDKLLDVNAWFISKMNYVLDCLNLEVKMINQTLPKVKNTSKHKYN